MEKFIEYGKRSKKEQRKANSKKRVSWESYGLLSPASKVVEDKKKKAAKNCCRGKFQGDW